MRNKTELKELRALVFKIHRTLKDFEGMAGNAEELEKLKIQGSELVKEIEGLIHERRNRTARRSRRRD